MKKDFGSSAQKHSVGSGHTVLYVKMHKMTHVNIFSDKCKMVCAFSHKKFLTHNQTLTMRVAVQQNSPMSCFWNSGLSEEGPSLLLRYENLLTKPACIEFRGTSIITV